MTNPAVPAAVVADLVAGVRDYLRLGAMADDAVLTRAAGAAIGLAETFCGTALIARPFEDLLAATGGWQRLRAVPVTAIAGVTALPAGGAPAVLAVDAYTIDIDADGVGAVRVFAPGTVAVSYTAGLAAGWASVPAPVAQGCVLLAAHLAEHREGDQLPPAAVTALWRPFRRLCLSEAIR